MVEVTLCLIMPKNIHSVSQHSVAPRNTPTTMSVEPTQLIPLEITPNPAKTAMNPRKVTGFVIVSMNDDTNVLSREDLLEFFSA